MATDPVDFLRQSVRDLWQPEELAELGTALFLDRPFGVGKAPAEPDATLLLSYEAFSPSLAERRLDSLSEKLDPEPGNAPSHVSRSGASFRLQN